MKNTAETEDAVQDTFFKLIRAGVCFESEEHEKAWLIKTAANTCKDTLKNWWRKKENLEDHHNLHGSGNIEIDSVFDVIMSLPEKYKAVVNLYYYEGYDSAEISKILGKPKSTIRYHPHMARKILKDKLGDEFIEK
jgi:RNA polymerase sigma-70 factor (ECF subfamily)